MLPSRLTESWRGQRVGIQDSMVIVVKAFLVKSGITQYGSRYAFITKIVNLYKEREKENGKGKAQSPKVN